MAKGKYTRSKGMGVKPLALLLALVLLVGSAGAGTLAWLTDKTETKANVFTVGNVDITLTEEKSDFKMIPGHVIEKDPKAAVVDGSEDCWLFVKINESTDPDLDAYIAYAIADGWGVVTGTKGSGEVVIGRKVMKTATEKSFSILGAGSYTDGMGTEATDDDFTITWTADHVGVKPSVTKPMMDAIKNGDKPTLTFTAYACQLYKTNNVEFSATDAWNQVKNLS